MESMKAEIQKIFKERFGEGGTLYASAGRINLIGEHTDYNGGFVFPGAIDKVIMAEIKPNGMEKVRVFSIDIDEYAEFGLKEEDAPTQSWARYIFGICREIQKRGGEVKGFDTVFAGNVPLGAGLSSSALSRAVSHSRSMIFSTTTASTNSSLRRSVRAQNIIIVVLTAVSWTSSHLYSVGRET